MVVITTYKRPELLIKVLQTIPKEQEIIIFQDGCTSDYSECKQYLSKNNKFSWFKYTKPHGKPLFWALHNDIFKYLKTRDFDLVHFLVDDCVPEPEFWDLMPIIFATSPDVEVVNPFVVEAHRRLFFGKTPKMDFGKWKVYNLERFDCLFTANKKFFERLKWCCKPVPSDFDWGRGSGVGYYTSERYLLNGGKIYNTYPSMFDHLGVNSAMDNTIAFEVVRSIMPEKDKEFKINKKLYVTVLMNCYKEKEEIFKKAVESVLSNKGVKIQLIVSTVKDDPCIKWCKDYPIELVINETAGIFTQFNAMIQYIKGDYTTYASANDVMYSNKLYDEANFLAKNQHIKVVYSDFDIIEVDGREWTFKAQEYNYEKHLQGSFVTDCTMIRSEIYRKYFPLNLKWGNNAVWDFYLRIYKGEGNVFAPLNISTWLYKKNKNSSSEKRKKDRAKYLENEKLKKELCNFHKKNIQLRTSQSISFFHNKMKIKYNLSEYNQAGKTIFLGLYTEKDYKTLEAHKGEAIILWGGSDAMRIKPEYLYLLKKHTNIAQSSFIQADLKDLDIDCELIPISTAPADITPTAIGDSVYFYKGNGTNFYGNHLIQKIKDITGLNIIIADSKTYSQEQLMKIYDKCFCALRLTQHDGLPHTVVEIGLKGRPSIFNGEGVPNCYKWKNETDISKTLLELYNKRFDIDTKKINKQMTNYLKKGDIWLNTL